MTSPILALSAPSSAVPSDDESARELYPQRPDVEKETPAPKDEKKVTFRETVEVCETCMDEYSTTEEESQIEEVSSGEEPFPEEEDWYKEMSSELRPERVEETISETSAPMDEVITEERDIIEKSPEVSKKYINKEDQEKEVPQESEDTVLESKEETYSETLEIVPKEDDTLPLEKTTKGVKVVPESGEVSFDIDVSIPEKKTEVSTLETSVVEEVTETEEITEEYEEQEEDITSTETFKQSVEILPKVKPDEVSSQQASVKIPVEETTEDYPIIEVPAPTEETLTEERETVDRKPQETSVDVTDASKQIQVDEVEMTLEGTKPEEVLYAETLEIAPK